MDCLKYCAVYEIDFRGHRETQDSLNRGHFLDLLSMPASFR